jgi:hypothetical protein
MKGNLRREEPDGNQHHRSGAGDHPHGVRRAVPHPPLCLLAFAAAVSLALTPITTIVWLVVVTAAILTMAAITAITVIAAIVLIIAGAR